MAIKTLPSKALAMASAVDLTEGSDHSSSGEPFKAFVAGKPLPQRSGFFQGRMVNKRSPAAAAFAKKVRDQLPIGGSAGSVLFGKGVPVALTVWFMLPRPSTDFKCNKRATGRLKNAARQVLFPVVAPDIDNMCKFLLDTLNGVVFADDRQIVKLVAHKCRDSEGDCQGGTLFQVCRHVPAIHGGVPTNYKQQQQQPQHREEAANGRGPAGPCR